MGVPISYVAVFVAAVANFILGGLWFGPLFGKMWAKLSGMTDAMMEEAKKKGMGKSYALMFIGSLIMAYTLAHALVFASTYLHVYGWSAGVMAGFWNWFGFIAPVTIGVVLWDRKPWKYWLVTYSYYLVGLCLMGVILAMWM